MRDDIKTILIVDDSPEDRTAIRLYVSEAALQDRLNLTCREAATGSAALAACRDQIPDCILLDHFLPDMDGLEFLARLTAVRGGELQVPVVMLTGSADKALTAAALRAGAQEYLPKHLLGPELLLRAMKSARDRCALLAERRAIEADLREASARRAAAETRAELFNNAPGVMVQAELTQDGQFRLTDFSDNVLRLTGFTADYLLIPGVWESMVDETLLDRQAVALRQAVATGEAGYETVITRADGCDVHIRIDMNAMAAGDGSWRIYGTAMDVTALHIANAARAAAEARMDVLVCDGPGLLFQDQSTGGAWRRTYVSDNAAAIIGHPPSRCVGPVSAWIAGGVMVPAGADGWDAWDNAVRRACDSGHASCEFTARHRAGHSVWLRANLRTRRDHGGNVLLTGYLTDISEERALAAALNAARHDLDEAIALGPGCLFRLIVNPDASSRVLYISESIERIVGYSVTEARAPGWFVSVIDPEHAPLQADQMQRLLRLEPVVSEYRLRTRSGDWIWVSETVSPAARPEADGSVRVVGYMTDITSLKERTLQLQQAARLALLGEMAAGMAHELRQPLTGISFAAQNAAMALDRNQMDSVRVRLGRIQEQTERASAIIEHLRLFGRGDDERADLVPVAVDRLVDGALSLVGEALRLDSVTVVSALGAPLPLILGHQARLEQVLVNLLLNARDQLVLNRPTGSRRITIAAERPGAGRFVVLSVGDNGGGIPPDLLPRLFQPFVTTKLAEKGTGLGLSICHGIVSKMGGTIDARNDADGAVFVLTLPLTA